MRTAHFDCFSGISGDMTLAALIDAGVDAEAIRQGIASLGLPIQLEIEKVRKGGFAATYVRVEAPEEDTHRHLPEVEAILGRGSLTPKQRDLALRIFRRLAEAEAAVHGLPIEKVHFHEVGALNSLADIAGAAIGLDLLGVERFTSRSVPTGNGMVKCAHGLMPIPAPATAQLLKGVPLASSPIKAELTTPTGAAILTTLVSEWIDHPVMTIEQMGHGAGRREFTEQPNLLRLFVGVVAARPDCETDQVWMLETNLDDLPAEIVGYCYDLLLGAGALDVFTTSIFMKKNRPGMLLSVLAPESALAGLEEILFRETTTLGVRRYQVSRHKLQRRPCSVETPWGVVQGKLGWHECQPPVFSPEYEDCARVAREHGVALREVYAQAQRARGIGSEGFMTDRAPSRWPLASVLIASFLLSAILVVLYVGPDLALRWRILEDQAAANAAFLRREAELKADSEAAERNLQDLDRRIHFVSLSFREVARKVAPVVVNLSNEKETQSPTRGRTFYDHETKRTYVEQAEGSGLLVKPGLVLTNYHVVREAERLRITFASGRWVTVQPDAIAADPDTDLAVVRLPAASALNQPDYSVTATFADSDKDVQVGDWVLAAGSPFGLKQTVTAGIVSAKGRVELGILDQVELIQTDAPINPGNSGGPSDQSGRVLGINVAIATANGGNQGVGFAIPSNAAREVFDQLIEKGEVVRGFLGISLQEVPPGLERRLGVEETGGVFVTNVGRQSPAADIGLQRGDLIVRYNHEPVGMVNAVSQLRRRIARTPPETTVPLEVLRGRDRLKLDVTIAKRPNRS